MANFLRRPRTPWAKVPKCECSHSARSHRGWEPIMSCDTPAVLNSYLGPCRNIECPCHVFRAVEEAEENKPATKTEATKNTAVAGHASKGNQAWCFEFVCECKARFNAKTAAARRQMWLDHLQEVRDARELSLDFDTLASWARRDQQECFQIEGTAAGKAEVAENLNMIDRVEKNVRDILAQRAR